MIGPIVNFSRPPTWLQQALMYIIIFLGAAMIIYYWMKYIRQHEEEFVKDEEDIVEQEDEREFVKYGGGNFAVGIPIPNNKGVLMNDGSLNYCNNDTCVSVDHEASMARLIIKELLLVIEHRDKGSYSNNCRIASRLYCRNVEQDFLSRHVRKYYGRKHPGRCRGRSGCVCRAQYLRRHLN